MLVKQEFSSQREITLPPKDLGLQVVRPVDGDGQEILDLNAPLEAFITNATNYIESEIQNNKHVELIFSPSGGVLYYAEILDRLSQKALSDGGFGARLADQLHIRLAITGGDRAEEDKDSKSVYITESTLTEEQIEDSVSLFIEDMGDSYQTYNLVAEIMNYERGVNLLGEEILQLWPATVKGDIEEQYARHKYKHRYNTPRHTAKYEDPDVWLNNGMGVNSNIVSIIAAREQIQAQGIVDRLQKEAIFRKYLHAQRLERLSRIPVTKTPADLDTYTTWMEDNSHYPDPANTYAYELLEIIDEIAILAELGQSLDEESKIRGMLNSLGDKHNDRYRVLRPIPPKVTKFDIPLKEVKKAA